MADPAAAAGGDRALLPRLQRVASKSLSRAQAIVGLVAAMLSIGGSVYGYVRATRPSDRGELVALVRESRNDRPVIDATIEVLTINEALVTSFATTDEASSRRALKEGMYRVRVRHPRFASEARIVQVFAGETSEVRFHLYPRVVAPPPPPPGAKRPVPAGGESPMSGAARAVSEGVEGLKKIFR